MKKEMKYGSKVNLAALACIVLAVYFPVLSNDFLYNWDDQWQVMNQFTEGGFHVNNFWVILTDSFHGQYSPVNQIMYAIIYSIAGYNPFAFHLASLLLHIGSVSLAYIIILCILNRRKTNEMHHSGLEATSMKQTVSSEHKSMAFITALLFAVHPLNVETVAWLSASKILVFTFFYLAATYTFIIYLERQKISYYILTLLLFALSFGGKEQAVTFPVWLLMLYWLLGYSLRVRKVWIQLIPFFALAIVFSIITMVSINAGFSDLLSNEENYPLWQRFIFGCYSLFEYLAKFLFPYKLLYIYPFPIEPGEAVPGWMLFYPVLLVTVVGVLWKYIAKIPLFSGLIFFLIHLALVLHIVPLSRYAIIADRYIYLSSIGLSFIIAFYLVRNLTLRTRLVRNTLVGLFIGIVVYLGIYSNLRCREWKDMELIKRDLKEIIMQHEDFKNP